MKKMRSLFLVLALGFGLCAERAQGQTSEQVMTFSIICQYVTNTYTTNTATSTRTRSGQLTTVLINSGNIAKAIAIDLFGTNWTKWNPANICYEVNLSTGNQGIYLRHGSSQTNVSSFFLNTFTNMFSQDVGNVFAGTNFAAGTNNYIGMNYALGTNYFLGTNYDVEDTGGTIPLIGGYGYYRPIADTSPSNTDYTAFGDLAYMAAASSNISFNLYGYSQGALVTVAGYYSNKLYRMKVDHGYITGAGTFSLNLTTNIFRSTLPTSIPDNDFNLTGLAHGIVYVNKPSYLNIGPPDGP